MNVPCKYYFCLCTRQLSATLALINNAKQSVGATVNDRMVDAGASHALATRLDDAAASIPIK